MMKIRVWALLVAAMLVLSACGTDADEGGDATTTAPAEETTTTAAAPDTTVAEDGATTTVAGETADGVHASETDLGSILVDAEGFTLYVFTNDVGGESSCYDSCEATWPVVPGDTAIGSDLDAAMFGTTARTDGTEQLTVNGQPLYRYAPDTSPGDTNGQEVGGVWFVVGVDGNMIGGPEASSDQASTDDPGRDY
jgi:predicted lipoprotein with Yx(FWY)xxD motif